MMTARKEAGGYLVEQLLEETLCASRTAMSYGELS